MARMDLIETLDARDRAARNSEWVPACGGTERPFTTRSGRRVLYVWQPRTGDHAYLDLGTDLLLSDAELTAHGLSA